MTLNIENKKTTFLLFIIQIQTALRLCSLPYCSKNVNEKENVVFIIIEQLQSGLYSIAVIMVSFVLRDSTDIVRYVPRGSIPMFLRFWNSVRMQSISPQQSLYNIITGPFAVHELVFSDADVLAVFFWRSKFNNKTN